jgi:hypothetical protein
VQGGTRRLSSAAVSAPIIGSFRQKIFIEGAEVMNLLFTIDLVTTTASAQYVPAPGGG